MLPGAIGDEQLARRRAEDVNLAQRRFGRYFGFDLRCSRWQIEQHVFAAALEHADRLFAEAREAGVGVEFAAPQLFLFPRIDELERGLAAAFSQRPSQNKPAKGDDALFE